MANHRAFTLLELMVSVAITGLLSAIIFSSFSQEKNRNALKSTVATLQADIQAMQTNAQGGVILGLPTEPQGYGVSLPTSGPLNGTYTTFGDRNGNKIYDDSTTDAFVKRVTFSVPQGVSINKITGIIGINPPITYTTRFDVDFIKPNGTAILRGVAGATIQNPDIATIYLVSSKLSNVCYAITITSGVGTVSQKKFSSACP